MVLPTGASASMTFDVTPGDTARALGSGALDVLATPRLLAWCEAATCRAVEALLDASATTVGTRVQLQHLLATPVGGRVEVNAELVGVDGRLLRFDVAATDQAQRLVGTGEVTRVVVDRERFAARVPPPDPVQPDPVQPDPVQPDPVQGGGGSRGSEVEGVADQVDAGHG